MKVRIASIVGAICLLGVAGVFVAKVHGEGSLAAVGETLGVTSQNLLGSSGPKRSFSAIGTVSNIVGSSITLSDAKGSDDSGNTTYTIDAQTANVVTADYAPISLSSISVGDRVIAQGFIDGDTIAARRIIALNVTAPMATSTPDTTGTSTATTTLDTTNTGGTGTTTNNGGTGTTTATTTSDTTGNGGGVGGQTGTTTATTTDQNAGGGTGTTTATTTVDTTNNGGGNGGGTGTTTATTTSDTTGNGGNTGGQTSTTTTSTPDTTTTTTDTGSTSPSQ